MTVADAATYLGISEATMRRLLPKIPHYRLGGPRSQITFDRADLDVYRESCRVVPVQAVRAKRGRVKDWCSNERGG